MVSKAMQIARAATSYADLKQLLGYMQDQDDSWLCLTVPTDFEVEDQPVQLTGYSDSKFLTSCSVVEVKNFVFEVNSYVQDVIASNNEIAELCGLNSAAKDTLGVEVILVDMGFKVAANSTQAALRQSLMQAYRPQGKNKAC